MALIWTEGAIADLEHIRRYVAALHMGGIERLARRIIVAAERIDTDPVSACGTVNVPLLRPFVLRVHHDGGRAAVLAVRQRGGMIL